MRENAFLILGGSAIEVPVTPVFTRLMEKTMDGWMDGWMERNPVP
jgi:hypothetical protein